MPDDVEPVASSLAVGAGSVSALLLRPPAARWLLVLGHGAGAGMRHRFMAAMSARAGRGRDRDLPLPVPLHGGGQPAAGPRARPCSRRCAPRSPPPRAAAPDLPLLAGGKSMGGRMTSLAAAEAPLAGVRGLVFFGFPLHAAGRPGERARRASGRGRRCRCCSSRASATSSPTSRCCARSAPALGARATLQVVPTADHGFHVLKRAGRSDDEVIAELADHGRLRRPGRAPRATPADLCARSASRPAAVG